MMFFTGFGKKNQKKCDFCSATKRERFLHDLKQKSRRKSCGSFCIPFGIFILQWN